MAYWRAPHRRRPRLPFLVPPPPAGASYFDMELDELDVKYEAAEAEDVRQSWQAMYELTHDCCCHGRGCRAGTSCSVGGAGKATAGAAGRGGWEGIEGGEGKGGDCTKGGCP